MAAPAPPLSSSSAPPAAAAAAAAASVRILDTSYVQPFHATKRFNLFLPFADSHLSGLEYTRDVLFYSLDPISSAAGPATCSIQALKHGLSLALVPFYPVAGRLHHDSSSGQLTIDCNDDGVEFVEAVTDCDFAELQDTSFPIHDFYADLARFSGHLTGGPQDTPLLSIQVTRFQGGRGIAIGLAVSHVVCDAYSCWYLVKSWGQCCRGQGVSLPPLHIRALMSSDFWGMDKDKLAQKSFLGAPVRSPLLPSTTKTHHKIMRFDSTATRQLKRTAVEESGNARISTFQAVIACVWKRFTAAQGLPPQQKLCLAVPVDLRHKLMPSLTEAYFGNALLLMFVRATAGDLKKESVGLVATKINESLKLFEDQMYIRERLAAREEELMNFAKTLEAGEQCVFVSRGVRHPVFDVDVGMGKPLAVRPATMSNDSHVCVYPGKEQGSIDVSLRFSSLEILQAFLCITCPCLDI